MSYAPALLVSTIPHYGPDAKLLLFLVIVGQVSDAFAGGLVYGIT